MGTFLRYLMAYGMQLAWQRSGKSGATPPVRMPFGRNKNKSLPLPIIGPWQMMIAMWLARQVWAIYGNQVKSKLLQTNNPVANHVHNLLPDTGAAPSRSTPAPTPVPAASTPTATPPSTPAPRSVPQYGTQVLDDTQNGSADLPPGSVLSSLRGQS